MNKYQDFLKFEEGYWAIACNDECITAIMYQKAKPNYEIRRSPLIDALFRQLVGYFDGLEMNFEIPLDLSPYTDFQRSVWLELQKIPYGTTISYSQLAKRLGNVNAVRAVAAANGKNPFPIVIPCHRVIGKNGDLTGYSLGLELKSYLLDLEGAIKEKQLSLF